MKTSRDPRHLERTKIMQELFAHAFNSANRLEHPTAAKIAQNRDGIDRLITESAPTWPIEKINKIDLAILRQAVYELVISKTAPPKVVVDEAVEIAKEYGSDASPSFINGALGKLITDQHIKI